jgi:hypothetical protein
MRTESNTSTTNPERCTTQVQQSVTGLDSIQITGNEAPKLSEDKTDGGSQNWASEILELERALR